MKTGHNNKLLLILTLSFILTSCEDDSKSKSLGISDARKAGPETHMQYLGCYPLGGKVKKECLEPLISIHKKDGKNEEYIQAFQFESEKLGFRYFLEDRRLYCEQVNDGPEYIGSVEAYLVKCSSEDQYLMAFDYDMSEWKFLQRKNFYSRSVIE